MIFWLIVLGIVIIVSASLIITTRKVTIPPMPSSPAVRRLMVALLKKYHYEGPIVELGAGWGGLSRKAARAFPNLPVTGVEISFLPFLFSWAAQKILRLKNLRYVKGDLFSLPLEPGSACLCYLSPRCMEKLESRLTCEESQGIIVVSAVFALPGRIPLEVKELNDLFRSRVYLYVME